MKKKTNTKQSMGSDKAAQMTQEEIFLAELDAAMDVITEQTRLMLQASEHLLEHKGFRKGCYMSNIPEYDAYIESNKLGTTAAQAVVKRKVLKYVDIKLSEDNKPILVGSYLGSDLEPSSKVVYISLDRISDWVEVTKELAVIMKNPKIYSNE